MPDIDAQQTLTGQQQLVLDQVRSTLASVDRAGEHLDAKAGGLLQAAGIVLALAGAFSLPGVMASPTTTSLIGLVTAFVAFVAMIFVTVDAMRPQGYVAPGTRDVDDLYRSYVYQDLDICFQQTLTDTAGTIELLVDRNAVKGKRITWAAALFVVQVVSLLAVVAIGT